MKIKKSLLLIGILNISILTAQDINYEIVYSLNMENFAKTFNKKENQNNAKLNNMIVDEAKRMNLKLRLSNTKSVFSEGKSMTMGNELQENLKVLVRAYSFNGAWMTDLNKKRQIFVREFENKKFFVEKPLVTRNWQFSQETKTIQGHLCHKATFIKTVPKGKFEIIAWYTKDIPVSLGPTEYVGELPGLILELDDITVTYKAVTVKRKTDVIIKWPNEKDIITEKQYKKEGDKVLDFYKKSN